MPAFDSDISPWIENTLATVKRPVQTNLARNGLAPSVFFFNISEHADANTEGPRRSEGT